MRIFIVEYHLREYKVIANKKDAVGYVIPVIKQYIRLLD